LLAALNSSIDGCLLYEISDSEVQKAYLLDYQQKYCIRSIKSLGFCATYITMMGCFVGDQREYFIIKNQELRKLCQL
jgi:hypothetical protein